MKTDRPGGGPMLTTTEKARLRKFDVFNRAFTQSKPSRVARRQLELSTKPDNESHFLSLVNRRFYDRPLTPPPTPLPPALQRIVDLQVQDGPYKGRWEPSSEIEAALGGFIPKAMLPCSLLKPHHHLLLLLLILLHLLPAPPPPPSA